MVNIPQDVLDFIPGKMGWIATVSAAGQPNVTPKGTMRVLDDSHLAFADLFSRKTRQNLKENPVVAVTMVDPATAKGYQLKGTAELLTAGDLFEQMSEQIRQMPRQMPPVEYVVRITVDEVYDQSVGLDAGKRIA